MNDYIILKKKDLTLERRFKTLYMNASWMRGRAQNRQRTVTGKLDVQEGSGGERWSFAIRCPYDHSDTTWGDILDLKELADEKDSLMMVDHFGDQREIVIVSGQMEYRPITPKVDGDALWVAQVVFEEVT